jgi:Tfp pilus assembly protein PilN
MKAHQIEHELEAIRIAGIASLDTSLYQAALSGQGIDVSFGAFDSTRLSAHRTEVQNYLHGASGLVVNGKHQNFLNQYLNRRRKKTDEESIGAGGLLIAAAFAVMVVLMMVCLVFMTMKQSKVKALEEQINDPVVLDQLNEYEMFMERNSFLQQQYDAIEDLNENITSYPVCNDDVLRVIEECRGSFAIVQFDSFDADQGLVSVTARAENVDDINKFIKQLNERELFKKIDYTGYSYDEQTALWDIHVTCTLTEAAGR